MANHDYFAELYVAGRLADAGWNVYFPHRDHGFDFIITKYTGAGIPIIRPVQVKGKYPKGDKTDKSVYGYVGKLTQVHPEMVLAIPYFSVADEAAPVSVAYMPFTSIKPHSKGYRCCPALFRSGRPEKRPHFTSYFDSNGIKRLELPSWKDDMPAGVREG